MAVDWYSVVAQIEGIEWIILLVIVAGVLLWGPSKLPEFARGVGRALGEFQRGRMEIEREIRTQLSDTPKEESRGRYDNVASALGVATVGRSEAQVKLSIARILDAATDEQLSAAARALGVFRTGSPISALKDEILKSLSR